MKVLRLKPRLMPHQVDFVMCDDVPIQGFVGGYRAGKSEALVWKALRCAVELFPGKDGIIIAPIAGMNQRNIVPIFRRILPATGLQYDAERLGNTYVDHIDIQIGNKSSRIYLNVSAENHTRMNGMSLAWGGMDEADLCTTPEIAYNAFLELGNRLSEGGDRAMQFAVSTPEGYGFMYKRFVEEAGSDTRIWHVKMTDNFLLPKGYLASRLKNIPANLQSAYIDGQFANIFTKPVYSEFDRKLNASTMTVKDTPRHLPLMLGLDFNVGHMAAVVHVIDEEGKFGMKGAPHAVDEFVDLYDTPAMIKAIQTKYPHRAIFVYPDASGKNRNSAGVDTNIALLHKAGFKVIVKNSNPRVGDRVNSMNNAFHNSAGERFYRVNPTTCPTYVRNLERQGWVKGEPDKSGNVDHVLDAGGYYIHSQFAALVRPTLTEH